MRKLTIAIVVARLLAALVGLLALAQPAEAEETPISNRAVMALWLMCWDPSLQGQQPSTSSTYLGRMQGLNA